jgi:hypothetical protein
MVVLLFPNVKPTVLWGKGPQTPIGIICTPKSDVNMYQDMGLRSNPVLPGVVRTRFSMVGIGEEPA